MAQKTGLKIREGTGRKLATERGGAFSGVVEIFDKDNMPWWFVRVPKKLSMPYEILADRGLIAVTASVGKSSWPTSLLPFGDNTHFIALPAKIRKAGGIKLGDKITMAFEIRERHKGKAKKERGKEAGRGV